MASIQLPAASSADSIITTWPRVQVATRQNWGDPWKPVNYLEALTFSQGCAPTIPQAKLRWRMGSIKREDQTTFSTVDAVDIRGQFVRIQTLPADGPDPNQAGNAQQPKPLTVFVGYVAEKRAAVFGLDATGTDQIPTIDQEFTAYGIEHLLRMVTLFGAFATNDGSTANYVDTPFIFNERLQLGLNNIGNRSSTKVQITFPPGSNTPVTPPSCYVFARPSLTAPLNSIWSVYDILEYLLTIYPLGITINIGGLAGKSGDAKGLLSGLQLPKVEVNGRTMYDAINELIDRRRGMGWCLRYNDDADDFTLFVFTVFDGKVQTADGDIIPPNGEVAPLDLSARSDAIAVQQLDVGDDATAAFGTIFAAGERILTAFTLSLKDGNLQPAWTSDEQTKYNTVPGVPTTDPGEFKRLADEFRKQESLSHVYTTFRVPNNWDWKAGSGEGKSGQNKSSAAPVCNNDGSVDTTKVGNTANFDHQFARSLPWQMAVGTTDFVPSFVQPFAAIKYQPPTLTGATSQPAKQWTFLHAPSSDAPGGHLYILDTDFAIKVDISPAYLMAAGSGASPGESTPAYDYNDLLVTVAVRTDASFHVAGTIPNRSGWQTLIINVPSAEYWYVLPGTVYDIQNGALMHVAGAATAGDGTSHPFNPAGGNLVLRNDVKKLNRVLAMATTWYSKQRRPVDLVIRKFLTTYKVGSYLSDLNMGQTPTQISINGVVTQLTYDVEHGTTTLRSEYSELDFVDGHASLPPLIN